MIDNRHNPMDEPRYCGVPTFMRTPHATDLNNLDIALIGLPYDGAVEARPGARQGPRQIRDMSNMMRTIHHVTRINQYELCRIANIVEVSPLFDSSGNTALIAATMMYEILCVLSGKIDLEAEKKVRFP